MKLETGTENTILRKQAEPIQQISEETRVLAREMKKTMIREKGVGLAAPQVGVSVRLIIALLESGEHLVLVNPTIDSFSGEFECGEEGCLSLPGEWGKVFRAKEITVSFQDLLGVKQQRVLSGLNARIVQHEIDHLNGVLFVDRLEKPSSLELFRLPSGKK